MFPVDNYIYESQALSLLQQRYAIAPQMADYDQIGEKQQWVPYLMSFCQPDCNFPSVSTNSFGFRTTLDRAGKPITNVSQNFSQASTRHCSIVVGGSTVFGVGATHDGHTIPSILNQITQGQWLNFGGRAFNSTQEVILFMLHLPRNIDRIVLFSGANNILLALLNNPSPVYGAFFNQSVFDSAMKNPSGEYVGIRRTLVQLLKEVCHCVMDRGGSPDLSGNNFNDDSYQNILFCFKRDLRAFKLLASGLGVQMYFALQPMATWIDKMLSSEEERLFGILDGLQTKAWLVLSKDVGTVRDRYFEDVAEICKEENVPFCNINLDPAFRKAEWLFVDRIHLTDRGNAVAAEIIKREFLL